LRHFTKLSLLRDFCLSVDENLTDSLWAKVASSPKADWTEEKVLALLKPKTTKKVKKDGGKKE